MPRFNIGDRVRIIGRGNCIDDNNDIFDREGVICDISPEDRLPYGIDFGEEIEDGHSCNRTCYYGHGWRVSEKALELSYISEEERKQAHTNRIIAKVKYLREKYISRMIRKGLTPCFK